MLVVCDCVRAHVLAIYCAVGLSGARRGLPRELMGAHMDLLSRRRPARANEMQMAEPKGVRA